MTGIPDGFVLIGVATKDGREYPLYADMRPWEISDKDKQRLRDGGWTIETDAAGKTAD